MVTELTVDGFVLDVKVKVWSTQWEEEGRDGKKGTVLISSAHIRGPGESEGEMGKEVED